METNGVFCTPELALICLLPELLRFSQSRRGRRETHEWMRGVEGSFEAALQGIRNLVSAGFIPR